MQAYAEKFHLEQYIAFKYEVVSVKPDDSFERSGKWQVTIRDLTSDIVSQRSFDGVMVCTGHHVYPNEPSFSGQESFGGQMKHSHAYKTADGYAGKKVLVVGIGNSACDIAAELASVAKQVYLSTRRGSWVMSRAGKGGSPNDLFFYNRFCYQFADMLPYRLRCRLVETILNLKYDHKKYGLKPKHRVLSAQPTVNDFLPFCILNGTVRIKSDIKSFGKNWVVFEGMFRKFKN